jgi:hypothetical protein
MGIEMKTDTSYLTIIEVGEQLKISPDSVARRFAHLPGVVDLGSRETMHKRRKRLLRIPQTVLDRYLEAHLTKQEKRMK